MWAFIGQRFLLISNKSWFWLTRAKREFIESMQGRVGSQKGNPIVLRKNRNQGKSMDVSRNKRTVNGVFAYEFYHLQFFSYKKNLANSVQNSHTQVKKLNQAKLNHKLTSWLQGINSLIQGPSVCIGGGSVPKNLKSH